MHRRLVGFNLGVAANYEMYVKIKKKCGTPI